MARFSIVVPLSSDAQLSEDKKALYDLLSRYDRVSQAEGISIDLVRDSFETSARMWLIELNSKDFPQTPEQAALHRKWIACAKRVAARTHKLLLEMETEGYVVRK